MAAKKIYYIEDDAAIGSEVAAFLTEKGYDITVFPSLAKAQEIIAARPPALCLVDFHLPDGDGAQLCRWIRSRFPELPVIFITVNNQLNDMTDSFRAGADDYITKPFELEVLHLRICALLRRTNSPAQLLACGTILADTAACRVWEDGRELLLSAMEYHILKFLLEQKNKTVTRAFFLENIWDANGSFVNDNTLTVTIKRLREKLRHPEIIKTIRSFGYRMEEL